MVKITLTPEQVALYRQATDAVQICDAQGKVLGALPPECTVEFIAELKRRAASQGPWYSGEQVQGMFRMLESAEAKEGPIDEARLNELLLQFEKQHG
jgi:hypothetical protein